jgi:hypothetical protein
MVKEPTPKEYRVMWEIDIAADSPEEAAREARRIQRDPKALVGAFEVIDREDGKDFKIDLDELDGVQIG